MGVPRLLLGSTPYIVSALGSASTRSEVTLRAPENWGRADSGSRTLTTVLIHIAAADEDTFKTRYEELRDLVVANQRDVVLEYASGSTTLAMKTSTREYAAVAGDMETVPGTASTIAALISVAFLGERNVQAAGKGTAGTIENPTGLQGPVRYEATFDEIGNLSRVISQATFTGASGVEAQARAATWRTLWVTTLPSFIASGSTLKDIGAKFAVDSTRAECVCTLTLERQPDAGPSVDGTVTVQRYVASIGNLSIGTPSGTAGNPSAAGALLSVTGELALRGTRESEFGGPSAAPAGGEAALRAQAVILIEHAKSKFTDGATASTVRPLQIDIRNGGWSCSFSYTAIVSTKLLAVTETVVRHESSVATVLRSADGRDRVYKPAGGGQRRVRVAWTYEGLIDATFPTPFNPGGSAELVSEDVSDPIITSHSASGKDAYGAAQTMLVQGSREYLIVSTGAGVAAAPQNPNAVPQP